MPSRHDSRAQADSTMSVGATVKGKPREKSGAGARKAEYVASIPSGLGTTWPEVAAAAVATATAACQSGQLDCSSADCAAPCAAWACAAAALRNNWFS